MRASILAGLLLLGAAAPPPQVLRVFPADGSTVSQATPLGAELDFTRGEAADPASLRLVLDGVDVTSQARVTQTRDWPPSFVSISYTARSLQPGSHQVELTFRTAAGAGVRYRWTFASKPP